MKNIFFPIVYLAILTITFISCSESSKTKSSTAQKENPAVKGSINPVTTLLSGYLTLKNALINDNGNEAAAAGNKLLAELSKIDSTAIPDAKRKEYTDIADDISENATHIAANAEKVAHQREHFESLSNDVSDLINLFGVQQKLYRDRCPMYNNGKGAIWISETSEIKNPYYGKQMLACGWVEKEY
ncbi:DUF3347 domain-containing protein [Pedobacter ghigonis]|uniref:DUF3347 domain-containing protein n=1 Tax=Pedobacter ghigonis TaxID=2730403 RepID=UPI00158F0350|nr:DUF3347 domain-containing protein [Pedobacter ghigonis]